MDTKVRYGILSTAWITVKGIETIRRSNYAELKAVSSRSKEKLENFVKRNRIDSKKVNCFLSYDEVINCEEVDIVYIPIPTALRFEYVKKAAEAKKHIIVEKPFVNAKEVEAMIDVCKKNGVCIMDNTMFVHHLRTIEIQEKYLLNENSICNRSNLKRVHSIFNYLNPNEDSIRYNPKLEPTGCLGDLGIYCLQGIISVGFGGELPVEVYAVGNRNKNTNSWTTVEAMMTFKNNRYASFFCSFSETTRQTLELIFSNGGIIRVDDFVIPLYSDIASMFNSMDVEEMKLKYDESAVYHVGKKNLEFEEKKVQSCYQAVCLIDYFSKMVLSKKYNYKFIENSVKVMKVHDAILKSVLEKKSVTL